MKKKFSKIFWESLEPIIKTMVSQDKGMEVVKEFVTDSIDAHDEEFEDRITHLKQTIEDGELALEEVLDHDCDEGVSLETHSTARIWLRDARFAREEM